MSVHPRGWQQLAKENNAESIYVASQAASCPPCPTATLPPTTTTDSAWELPLVAACCLLCLLCGIFVGAACTWFTNIRSTQAAARHKQDKAVQMTANGTVQDSMSGHGEASSSVGTKAEPCSNTFSMEANSSADSSPRQQTQQSNAEVDVQAEETGQQHGAEQAEPSETHEEQHTTPGPATSVPATPQPRRTHSESHTQPSTPLGLHTPVRQSDTSEAPLPDLTLSITKQRLQTLATEAGIDTSCLSNADRIQLLQIATHMWGAVAQEQQQAELLRLHSHSNVMQSQQVGLMRTSTRLKVHAMQEDANAQARKKLQGRLGELLTLGLCIAWLLTTLASLKYGVVKTQLGGCSRARGPGGPTAWLLTRWGLSSVAQFVAQTWCYVSKAVESTVGILALGCMAHIVWRSGFAGGSTQRPVLWVVGGLGLGGGAGGAWAIARVGGSVVPWVIVWEVFVLLLALPLLWPALFVGTLLNVQTVIESDSLVPGMPALTELKFSTVGMLCYSFVLVLVLPALLAAAPFWPQVLDLIV